MRKRLMTACESTVQDANCIIRSLKDIGSHVFRLLIGLARVSRASGGKTGGIAKILKPKTAVPEPCQNVFWGSGQSLTEASVTALECLFQRVFKDLYDPLPSIEFCCLPPTPGAKFGARLLLKRRAPKMNVA